MKDYVHKEQGIVCSDCTVDALHQGLIDAFAIKYERTALRQYVKQYFSPEFVAKQYSNLYHSLLIV